MKNSILNKRLLTLLFLAAFVAGAAFAGAMAFSGKAVQAQSQDGGAGENEADDGDDGAEGADVPITGVDLERASAAALDYIGEGRVTDTEVGDEEGYYEVEITRDNGREVDVHLDESFNVLSHEDE